MDDDCKFAGKNLMEITLKDEKSLTLSVSGCKSEIQQDSCKMCSAVERNQACSGIPLISTSQCPDV